MIIDRVVKLSDISSYKSINKNVEGKKCSLQFLPSCMEGISRQKTIQYKSQKLKTSYLIDIIHSLILKYYFKKENKFHLMASILKEKYGYLYNYHMDFLIEKNILILLSNHQKGKNARVYAINETILRGNIIRYSNYDRVLLKKYKAKIIQMGEDTENRLIDNDIKLKLIDDLFSVQIEFDRSIFYLDSLELNDIDVYNRNRYSVECIDNKHIFYHFDNFGRLHTNFTILKSFIRKNCLLIDGDSTCEFDINNSQPLFLTKIIDNSETCWVKKDEYDLFKYLTLNGKYYQYLINESNISSKKEAKELTYKVLFGRNSPNSKSDKIFSKLFPTIHNFIKLYKREYGDYKILAYDLQKAESNLIFNEIIRELMYYPEIKVITIHDSIVCSIKYRDVVSEIFYRKLNLYFG